MLRAVGGNEGGGREEGGRTSGPGGPDEEARLATGLLAPDARRGLYQGVGLWGRGSRSGEEGGAAGASPSMSLRAGKTSPAPFPSAVPGPGLLLAASPCTLGKSLPSVARAEVGRLRGTGAAPAGGGRQAVGVLCAVQPLGPRLPLAARLLSSPCPGAGSLSRAGLQAAVLPCPSATEGAGPAYEGWTRGWRKRHRQRREASAASTGFLVLSSSRGCPAAKRVRRGRPVNARLYPYRTVSHHTVRVLKNRKNAPQTWGSRQAPYSY